MKRIFGILFILTFITLLYADSVEIKTAMTMFQDLSVEAENQNMGANSTNYLQTELAKLKWYKLRKTGDIESYLNYLEKVQLGMENPANLKAKSANLAVDYLTVGSVAMFNGNVDIDIRTVNVNTWAIVHSSGINGFDYISACNYLKSDMKYTFKPEDLQAREAEFEKANAITVFKFNNLNDTAMEKGYGEAFSEIMNSELGSLRELKVIERTHAKSIINEKIFIMSGIIENDDSNSVLTEAGIDFKIVGDINVIGNLICINYRVINVSNNRLIFLGYREASSPEALRAVARSISKTITNALVGKIGSMKISVMPENATIQIDNDLYKTNSIITALEKGEHKVKLELVGYKTIEQVVTINPKEVKELNFELEEIPKEDFFKAQNNERSGNWEKSIELYKKYISQEGISDDDYDFALYRIGNIYYYRLEDYTKAKQSFKELVDRYPDALTRSEALYGLGLCLQNEGDDKQALKIFTTLKNKYPDSTAAWEIEAMGLLQ